MNCLYIHVCILLIVIDSCFMAELINLMVMLNKNSSSLSFCKPIPTYSCTNNFVVAADSNFSAGKNVAGGIYFMI